MHAESKQPAFSESPRAGGLLRLFSASVFAQAILSCANFLVALVLFRYTTDAEFGMFVLLRSAVVLLTAAQDAWIFAPMAVVVPGKSKAAQQHLITSCDARQRRILRWAVAIALPLPALGGFLGFWSPLISALCTLGVLWSWASLHRDFLRGVLLIHSRSNSMLFADLGFVAVLLAGLTLSVLGPDPVVIGAVVSLTIASWAGSRVARHSLARDPGWKSGDETGFSRELRPLAIWGTIGAATYWTYSLGYNYVLAGRLDLTAVRDVNAAHLLLMPTVVLTLGVKTLLLPTAAGWLANSNLDHLLRRLVMFAAGILAIDLLYIAFMWIFRDWLTPLMVFREINDRDRLLVYWALISVSSQMREILQIGLLALRRFQTLTALTAVSAVVSLSIIWIKIDQWGAVAALVGQLAGEVVNTLGVITLLIIARWRQRRAIDVSASSGRT